MTGLLELRDLAVTIAREAGELAARRRAEGVSIAASKSSLEDVVTEADREVEDLIRSRLGELRPDDAFLGEESGAEGGSSGLTWVVDPIDGTVNYLYGIPDYCVSIAVVEGEPEPSSWTALAGAVFAPAKGELFTAAAGHGAFRGDERLAVNTGMSPALALVGTGFGYSAEKRVRQAAVVGSLIAEVRDIRRIGAAALDLCAVACGRIDAYYESGLNPWDQAAGVLIAQEAGARVEGRGGAPADREFTIAAAPEIFGFLHDRVANAQ
ncbi:inositol monophosphatase family protein [Labedella endophytica]|uniref:Inositol-1-monophosphatase n=1 Tax=Labedella endophytica TaxID=1523160 RepID=A0A433JWP9_9MICO|nr:inositol monophosphatase family protein [Labedella endophytica]RUR03384.1 inositol monophosphatase [Labedella endophytica]